MSSFFVGLRSFFSWPSSVGKTEMRVLSAALLTCVSAAPAADLVSNLPGYGAPPSPLEHIIDADVADRRSQA